MTARPLQPGDRVAVVGAGAAGLAAARALALAGLEPFVLEQDSTFAGQLFPRADAPGTGGLARRVVASRVARRLRLGARVTAVRPAEGAAGWDVTIEDAADGGVAVRRFAAVVGCSGRVAGARRPQGLDGLAARVRVGHAAAYAGRAPYRDRRVLVLGDSVRGAEIAADLAADPSITVLSACRRPLWRGGDRTAVAAALRAALAAAGELDAADPYISLAATGRIDVRPALTAIGGERVVFADGSGATVDDVLLATGFEVALPYLDADLDTLDALTFVPGRHGLAVLGRHLLAGPAEPVLEAQARFLAAVWTGRRAVADLPEPGPLPFHPSASLTTAFAAAAGAARPREAVAA